MKKTDVKKTERSKEFLAEEWLEIVLKGQDKGEGRFCRYGVCSFMGRQPLTFWPVKRKPELEKQFMESRIMESRIMESRTMKNRFRGTRNSWFGHTMQDLKMDLIYPEDKERKYPCIVWICGGAWLQMDRSAHLAYLSELARKGFTVASLSVPDQQ